MGRSPGCHQRPDGIAVTPAGETLHDLSFTLHDLPDPETLGPYRAYVAWATTPQLNPEIRLGVGYDSPKLIASVKGLVGIR
jgi:hypothetical protein